jgi:CheY-like chemotaxis protein
MKTLLEVLGGHTVEVAHTGPAGVAAAATFRPDAVVSDLGLPGMDGFAVARALRANPATAGILLVAISGYAGEEDRRRSRDAGFDAHLQKPADPEALQRLLATVRPA